MSKNKRCNKGSNALGKVGSKKIPYLEVRDRYTEPDNQKKHMP
jgi:hypothetical protein